MPFLSAVEVAARPGPPQCFFESPRGIERTVHQAGKADDNPRPAYRDEGDLSGVAGLETDSGAGRDGGVMAEGGGAIKAQARVHLKEMEVR
jgi:hypothetical protein